MAVFSLFELEKERGSLLFFTNLFVITLRLLGTVSLRIEAYFR